MCGIVGYIGGKNAINVVVEGLTRLEYRGYDSAGIALTENGEIITVRAVGKLINLKNILETKKLNANVCIGHTRWASHGRPSEENAHPHTSDHIAMVHNGIIENYKQLKDELINKGYRFSSDTDTEVFTHLVHSYYEGDLFTALHKSVAHVRGSYAVAVISSKEPGTIVVARKDSPLVLGVSQNTGEYIASSDISAALSITKDFIMLGEGELAKITNDGPVVYASNGEIIQKEIIHVNWNPEMAEKSGYPDFMIKEIHEQPRAIIDTLRGKLIPDEGIVTLGELDELEPHIKDIKRIILVACGTSWHASLIGKLYIEQFAHIPVESDISSEFLQRTMPLDGVLVVCISQSGETADTKLALRAAKSRGAKVAAICNVVGSAIATEADYCVFTHAGPEVSVASTKAFSCQSATLLLIALWMGNIKQTVTRKTVKEVLSGLLSVPEKIKEILNNEEEIACAAKKYKDTKHFLYIGRHYNYPIAYEGALKLKEISYIHAEAYPSGELKHGPIALLDESMPVMVYAPDSGVKEKVFSTIQEVKARGAKVVAVLSDTAKGEGLDVDTKLYVPVIREELSVFLTVVVAQIFAYYSALYLGRDIDKPRNLAKSVTIE